MTSTPGTDAARPGPAPHRTMADPHAAAASGSASPGEWVRGDDTGSTGGRVTPLVRTLSLTVFLQWLGASAVIPMLPEYVRHRGGTDSLAGVVMAAFFVAGVLTQYPAGRLADRIGRRTVLLAGLALYAATSVAFVAPVSAVVDVGLRALQGVGAGAAEVSSLAMVSAAVTPERRGRAFASIYGGQIAGMAVGPLVGSIVGVDLMWVVFLGAAAASATACIPASLAGSPRREAVPGGRTEASPLGAGMPGSGPPTGPDGHRLDPDERRLDIDGRRLDPDGHHSADGQRPGHEERRSGHDGHRPDPERGVAGRRRDRLDRATVGALLAAAVIGLTSGVYETCWTLLLHHRGASDWAIGLSWTLFAVPFVLMTRPSGWLADHVDRRHLAVGGLGISVGFCATYPFLGSPALLVVLGAFEATGLAIAMPSAQSLLTQAAPPTELGRIQGLYSTSQTASTAVSAAAGGALFSLAVWAPFVVMAAVSLALLPAIVATWAQVRGRVVGPALPAGSSG